MNETKWVRCPFYSTKGTNQGSMDGGPVLLARKNDLLHCVLCDDIYNQHELLVPPDMAGTYRLGGYPAVVAYAKTLAEVYIGLVDWHAWSHLLQRYHDATEPDCGSTRCP